jgi:hypothetical protein
MAMLSLVATALIALPSLASAAQPGLEPGVHVDPNSPAAKEYAIPLGQARAGGTATGSDQLFGSGIKPGSGGGVPPAGRPTTAAPPPSGGGTTHPQNRPNTPNKATAGTRHAPQGAAAAKQLIGLSQQGSGGITWMLAAAAAVLVLGALGGAAVARRNRSATPRTG